MDIDLLKKYFSNNCSPDELEEIISWFKNNAGGIDGRAVLKQLWEELEEEEVQKVNFDHLLDKIHHRINIESSKKGFSQTYVKNNLKGVVINFLIKAAAVLFIPLLLGSLYFYNKAINELKQEQIYSEITSPNGSRTSFELPDGSMVWLNNGSSLRFPTRFTGDYRLLEISGEAYFKVVHNKEMPLIVRSHDLQIKVHGTEFNVMAYPEDENIAVTLQSGSISLQKVNKNRIQNLIKLKPNQHAIFNIKQQELSYMDIKPDKFTSWKDGKLIFIDDPIDVIVDRLERWYNVDIELKDKELSKYTYTATFTDEQLEQVLSLLKVATPIKYKIIKSEKLKDGSFSKKKVIIALKR
ncbi:MAG: FecR domain-containing protein [Bacteroidota bacterium]